MKINKLLVWALFFVIIAPAVLAAHKAIAGKVLSGDGIPIVDAEVMVHVTVTIDGIEYNCTARPLMNSASDGTYATDLANLKFDFDEEISCADYWKTGDVIWSTVGNVDSNFVVIDEYGSQWINDVILIKPEEILVEKGKGGKVPSTPPSIIEDINVIISSIIVNQSDDKINFLILLENRLNKRVSGALIRIFVTKEHKRGQIIFDRSIKDVNINPLGIRSVSKSWRIKDIEEGIYNVNAMLYFKEKLIDMKSTQFTVKGPEIEKEITVEKPVFERPLFLIATGINLLLISFILILAAILIWLIAQIRKKR